ncbi:MAG TPA: YkvA family protein [Candidatus Binatia bacterium]|nr:YkvA family protein [Candidatus Binatia bacterium]
MILAKWRGRARALKRQGFALYFAVKDPRVPWYAKLLAGAVVAYAVSPIDLIPDFIPVIGYLDDLVLVPLGVVLAVKLIPPDVWAECLERAERAASRTKLLGRIGAAAIIAVWLLVAAWVVWKIFER